jgi:Trk-type K+ transport system membrane component
MLSNLGKVIVTFLMFVGRVGPLTFGMVLFLSGKPALPEEDEDVAI